MSAPLVLSLLPGQRTRRYFCSPRASLLPATSRIRQTSALGGGKLSGASAVPVLSNSRHPHDATRTIDSKRVLAEKRIRSFTASNGEDETISRGFTLAAFLPSSPLSQPSRTRPGMLLWQWIFHVECPSQGVKIHDDVLHVECRKVQYRHFFIVRTKFVDSERVSSGSRMPVSHLGAN